MATRDTLIEVPLKATLDQGKDEPSVVAPGLLSLENGVLTKEGGIKHRLGAVTDVFSSLTGNTEARSIAEYNGKPIVGTTQGVFSYPSGVLTNNSPSSTYDSVVDHETLSGIPNNLVEIDSASNDDYTAVLFTVDSTFSNTPTAGNSIWYAVFYTSTRQLVRKPVQIQSGGQYNNPLVVLNSQGYVSFWWKNGTQLTYTLGTFLAGIVTGPVPSLTIVAPAGVNVQAIGWSPYDSGASNGQVAVFYSTTSNDIVPRTSSGSLQIWNVNAGRSIGYIARVIKAFVYEAFYPNRVYVAAVEDGPAALGSGIGGQARVSYWTGGVGWAAAIRSTALYASPEDATYTIYDGNYLPTATRATIGAAVDSTGAARVAIWGTSYYKNAELGPGQPSPLSTVGSGCCTTYATVDLELTGNLIRERPLFTYALVTEAFPVPGRQCWVAGLARSGISVPRDKDGKYTRVFADSFSACIVSGPREPFAVSSEQSSAESRIPQVPLARVFDLRIPISVWGGNPIPFSMGKPYVLSATTDAVALFMRTRVSDFTFNEATTNPATFTITSTTLGDFSYECGIVTTRPSPGRRYTTNDISAGRGIADYYDGTYACEMVVHDFPLMDIATLQDVDTGYGYAVVYSWEDGGGNIHRSAPTLQCIPLKIDNKQNICVWDFPISGVDTISEVLEPRYVELYWLSSTGTYLFVGRTPYTRGARRAFCPHLRQYLVEWFFDVANTDTSKIVGALLYTTGGVLENQAPPHFKDVCVAKNRLFGLTDTKLFYTKPIQDRVAPEFNYALTVDIPDDTGATTAIMAMDDKLVVLCERGTYVLYGDGPNALGTGGQFAQLLRIPGNIGCAYPGSAVECPLGIAFLSQQGMYLLDRGVNLSFVGQPVLDETNAIANNAALINGILGAVHDIQGLHVRWVVEGSAQTTKHLVWYYAQNQWGTFSSAAERQQTYIDNRIYGLVPVNVAFYVLRETDAVGMYGASAFPMLVRTGWIRFANIEGFQRAKEVAITYRPGKDPGASQWEGLVANIYSDYIDVSDSTHQWTSPQMTTIYAADAVKERKDFSISVKTQKTPAISVEFSQVPYDVQGNPTLGVRAILSGISVVVGAKSGTNKQNLATARTR